MSDYCFSSAYSNAFLSACQAYFFSLILTCNQDSIKKYDDVSSVSVYETAVCENKKEIFVPLLKQILESPDQFLKKKNDKKCLRDAQELLVIANAEPDKNGFETLVDIWYRNLHSWLLPPKFYANSGFPLIFAFFYMCIPVVVALFGNWVLSLVSTFIGGVFFEMLGVLFVLLARKYFSRWWTTLILLFLCVVPVASVFLLSWLGVSDDWQMLSFSGLFCGASGWLMVVISSDYRKNLSVLDSYAPFVHVYVREYRDQKEYVILDSQNNLLEHKICGIRDDYVRRFLGAQANKFLRIFSFVKRENTGFSWFSFYPAFIIGRERKPNFSMRNIIWRGYGWFIPRSWEEIKQVVPSATLEDAIEYFAFQPFMLEPPPGYEEFVASQGD